MTGHIFIDGEIGIHTKPDTVRSQISNEFSDYEIHINSIGGDVYDGYQIGNMILNIGKPTTAIVEGMCASIATFIACSADKIVMIPQGSWIIHDPTAQTGGRAEDLIQAANQLRRIKDDIIARYMSKVGKKGITQQQLSDAMAKETEYDSATAQQWGFADEVREKLRAVAKIDLTKFKMETLTKQEHIGLFEKLGQKLDSLISAVKEKPKPEAKVQKEVIKPKNSLELTLTDGTVLLVDTEDPNNLQNATVTTQDGSELKDGTYETVDGMELEIAGNTIVEAEQQPVNESDDNPTEDNDPNIKNEGDIMESYDELMGQLEAIQQKLKKAVPGAQPATQAPAAKAKAVKSFSNKTEFVAAENKAFQDKIEELERQIAEMKTMTVGAKNPPVVKPVNQVSAEEEYGPEFSSFASTVTNYLQGRGLISRNN